MRIIVDSVFRYLKKRFDGTGVLKIGIFRWIRNLMFKSIKKVYIDLEGYKLKLDKNDSLRLSLNPKYEEMTGKLMREIVKPGDYVVDVGANIGYWTLFLSKLVSKSAGWDGAVFAFEPEETNYNILKSNIHDNNITNCDIFNIGLSNDYHVGKLYLSDTNSGDHSSVNDGNRKFQYVQYKRLDDIREIFDRKREISLIKIDVQGSEMMLLEGAKEFFRQNPNIKIITELWDYGLRRAGASAAEYLTELEKLGFSFELIDERLGSSFSISKEGVLNSVFVRGKNYCNLLCRKLGGEIRGG
ncbi:MAG: FkbM family methyltransferase [bacterium]|nr:FkbM family methyltransferase [bacterium]